MCSGHFRLSISSELNCVVQIELFSKFLAPKVLDFISYRPVLELLDGWLFKKNKIKAETEEQNPTWVGEESMGEWSVLGEGSVGEGSLLGEGSVLGEESQERDFWMIRRQ